MIEILALIGIAALAIETAYHSELAYELKQKIWLTEDKQQRLRTLSQYKFWTALFGKYLSWLAFIPVLFFYFYHKINQMTNCPYCVGFWMSLAFLLLSDYALLPAIALTGITLITVHIIEALMSYVNNR